MRFAPPARARLPDYYWVSLRYFNYYRACIASLALLLAWLQPEVLHVAAGDGSLFLSSAVAYWMSAIAAHVSLRRWQRHFDLQLTIQVAADVLLLGMMVHAGDGLQNGMAVLLPVSLAGAGLVGQGRLVLFYASLATLALLLDQAFRWMRMDGEPNFFAAGLFSIACFATAVSARLLAKRVLASEEVARRQRRDLERLTRVNQLAVADMQDGMLAVDGLDRVWQRNAQAEALLGVLPELGALADHATELAQGLAAWRAGGSAAVEFHSATGCPVRARFVAAGSDGDALVFVEDAGRIEERARELKLAAIGRLTANMAHEIRNPLSAITHAAGLLREERRADLIERLTRIIEGNARRLEGLVRDVLELGRQRTARPEALEALPLCRRWADELTETEGVPGGVFLLEAEPGAAGCLVSFDRGHLRQVVVNLLANALRHGRRDAASVRLRLLPRPQRGYVEFHFQDDGPGVGQGMQEKLFEPFASASAQGTGLGLYIARELCLANGARLEYRGNDPGAHFCVVARSAG